MDWIRLGASGKDLTGVGSRAGHLSVTHTELAIHNKESDAWLSIRGKVYNVTAYLPFHPGGRDELMRGVGRDATSLFDEVHPWVNYDQILQKCYLGQLVSIDPRIDTESLFLGTNEPSPPQITQTQQISQPPSPQLPPPPPQPHSPKATRVKPVEESATSATADQNDTSISSPVPSPIEVSLPRFDWIQKLDFITVMFYTGAFSNPALEIQQTNQSSVSVLLTYASQNFDNEIVFFKNIQWPCQTRIFCETGKVELVFRKEESCIWDNYGVLRQTIRPSGVSAVEAKIKYHVINKILVNYNTVLIELERIDGKKVVVPLGKHIKVFASVDGEEISRSYTPVPSCLFHKYRVQTQTTDTICLMVKRYSDGNLSRILCDSQIGDSATISRPIGSFNLQEIERRENFIILSAGTGITPMLSIILFLLERRIRKCQSLRLLFFNRSSKDILIEEQLRELQIADSRFKVDHVLSQPETTGYRGHISRSLLEETIKAQLANTTYIQRDLYVMVCGPAIFATLTHQLLGNLEFGEDQYYIFSG